MGVDTDDNRPIMFAVCSLFRLVAPSEDTDEIIEVWRKRRRR